ncbi:hypothetical protein [Bartonella machadoae]|uniref:hypothetical protein n=1 Tax=Bartonella machadoae TaxID=2893471 RepID=UPI001F4D20FD|nr:hypothetical protein [Bartonella machadoae]UNE53599.1 hypothetical protein LNM86_08065 [Bartonella machadoae]
MVKTHEIYRCIGQNFDPTKEASGEDTVIEADKSFVTLQMPMITPETLGREM